MIAKANMTTRRRRLAFSILTGAILLLLLACAGSVPRPKKQDEQQAIPFGQVDAEKPTPKEEPPTTKKDQKPPTPDLSVADLRKGDVTVSLLSTSIQKITGRSFRKTESEDDCFRVRLQIHNNHATRRLDYRGWGDAARLSEQSSLATLTDEHGNTYKRAHFGFGSRIDGQIQTGTIDPGDSLVDVLVFEKPLPISKQLTLTLPLRGAIQGQSGELRGLVPLDFTR